MCVIVTAGHPKPFSHSLTCAVVY